MHLGRAPGALVAHEAAVHHEVGGRAEPVAAGEEQLLARGQVVGAHDVPRVRRQGQGVAVHAHSRGVRGRCSRCWGGPSSLTVRRPWGPGSALLWRPPPRRPLRRPDGYLQRRGRLRDSELARKEAVYLRDGVVAEQRGGDARVLVGG